MALEQKRDTLNKESDFIVWRITSDYFINDKIHDLRDSNYIRVRYIYFYCMIISYIGCVSLAQNIRIIKLIIQFFVCCKLWVSKIIIQNPNFWINSNTYSDL